MKPKQEHTPAPWTIQQTGDHTATPQKKNQYVTTWITARGGVIAQIHPCSNPRKAFNDPSLPDTTSDSLEPIGQANACLIAAAPELLAALETFTLAAETAAHPRGLEAQLLPHTEAARAIIEKVKG